MVNLVAQLSLALPAMSLAHREPTDSTLIDVRKLPTSPRNRHAKNVEFLRVAQKTLHRRGISKEHIDNHPLPDRIQSDNFTNGAYMYDLGMAGEMPYAVDPPRAAYSGQSSPAPPHSDVSHSMLSLSLGTGNTTERSSVDDSMAEDDFEREATRNVRTMFEEIDSNMFEGNKGPGYSLATECQEWIHAFPHIRILGRQILPPQDKGIEIIPGDSDRSIHGNDLMDVTEHELSVLGQAVQPSSLPLSSPLGYPPGGDALALLEEEILEQDGSIEDIIALDFRSSEDDRRSHMTHRRRRRGLPPITPQACVKDNIIGAAFDYIWSESISWLRMIMKQYAINIVLDGDDLRSEHMVSVGIPGVFHELSPNNDQTFLPTRESQFTSRLAEHGLKKGLNPTEGFKLDGLLTISSKALQSRVLTEKSLLGDTMEGTMDSRYTLKVDRSLRPSSSFRGPEFARPASVRGDAVRQVSARRVGKPLPPIEGRVKTPSVEDERLANAMVQGKGINMTGTERQNSPPLPPARNGVLPPLALELQTQELPTTFLKPQKRYGQRASSAVHNDKETRLGIHMRERERTVIGVPSENRPSTTHATYRHYERSETPFGVSRRSSTPLGGNINSLRLSHNNSGGVTGSAASANLTLNITGNSINPQADGAVGISELVETDEYDDMISAPKWDPQYRRLVHSSVFRHYEGSNLHPGSGVRRTRPPTYIVR